MQLTYLRLGIFLAYSVLVVPYTTHATTPSADEIVKQADKARGPEGTFSFRVDVEDLDRNKLVTKTKYKVYSKNSVLTLIETQEPERLRGRKLLMHDNDLWLYLPSIRRPTRVSFQQKLTGEVANGDIARTLFARDYKATLLGTESIANKQCYKLKLHAINKEATYREIVYWVEMKTLFPVRMQCFAISGKLLKTGDYSEPKLVFKVKRASKLIISDALQPHRKSILRYAGYRKEKLDDSFFSKESLAE